MRHVQHRPDTAMWVILGSLLVGLCLAIVVAFAFAFAFGA